MFNKTKGKNSKQSIKLTYKCLDNARPLTTRTRKF